MHHPSDIGRELLRLGTRQYHAVIQRMQKTVFGYPPAPLDQLLMHDADLARRTTEADETQLEPIIKRFTKRYGRGWRIAVTDGRCGGSFF